MKTLTWCTCFALLFCLGTKRSQAQLPAIDLEKKQARAIFTPEAPAIDGILDEQAWQNAPIATGLVTLEPNPGLKPA